MQIGSVDDVHIIKGLLLTPHSPNDLIHGHTAQSDHAVYVAVNRDNLIGLVQAGDQEFGADFFGSIALEVALITGITNIHIITLLTHYTNLRLFFQPCWCIFRSDLSKYQQ